VRAVLLPLLVAGSCGWNAAGGTGCRPAGPPHSLPEVLRESSGVAWSRVSPGVLWSHNDSGHEATLYAINDQGDLLGSVPLQGATNRDWEDLAVGPCPAGSCLYVGDIGDNAEARDGIVLYRVEDTGTFDDAPRTAEAFPMVLPDGPRDMEALFVLPGGEVYLVSKGRSHPVTVYRYPPPLRAGETVTLEAVQTLTDGPVPLPSQVTGADATADGRVVAIRTYQALTFYGWEEGKLVPRENGRVDLRTLQESQGEGVALGPGGRVALTAEAGPFRRGATLNLLECRVAKTPDRPPHRDDASLTPR
jgi:hypothetical protein